MNIECSIRGEYIDNENSRVSYNVDLPVTLAKIQDNFPFEGHYHFRLKTPGKECGFSDIDYVWVDLLHSDDVISIFGQSVEVQALILATPDYESKEDGLEEYLTEVSQAVPIERPPIHAQSSTTGISLKSLGEAMHSISQNVQKNEDLQKAAANLKKGATSMWNSMLATASTAKAHLQNHSSSGDAKCPSDPSVTKKLLELSLRVATTFNDSDTNHLNLLRSVSFQRRSPVWKEAGYQNVDPVADFRSTGLLSIYCLIHMKEACPRRFEQMVQSNKVATKSNYPFAVVSVNLTLMLIEIFSLKENKFANVSTTFWEMFREESTLNEIFSLLFVHIDNLWTSRQAVRADFGKIMGEVKALLLKVLKKGPCSLQDLKYSAFSFGVQPLED